MFYDFFKEYNSCKDSLLNLEFPPTIENINKYFVEVESLEELEKKIRDSLENISLNYKSITVDWEERIINFTFGKHIFQLSFILFQKEDKISFEFIKPFKFITISSKRKFYNGVLIFDKFFIGLIGDVVKEYNNYLTKNIIEYKLKLKRKDNKILDNNNNFYYI